MQTLLNNSAVKSSWLTKPKSDQKILKDQSTDAKCISKMAL